MERKNGVRTEQHGTLMLNKSELRELRFINKFQKKRNIVPNVHKLVKKKSTAYLQQAI